MHQANAENSSSSSDTAAPLSEDQIEELNEYYGFNKPVIVAYAEWLWKVIKLDLGTSQDTLTRYGTRLKNVPNLTFLWSYLHVLDLSYMSTARCHKSY